MFSSNYPTSIINDLNNDTFLTPKAVTEFTDNQNLLLFTTFDQQEASLFSDLTLFLRNQPPTSGDMDIETY